MFSESCPLVVHLSVADFKLLNNASAFTFSTVLSSLHTPHQQLHSSMDPILSSPVLVVFPVLQRQKTITHNKICKVACSQVSGPDLDSNKVLGLGLDFKQKSEEETEVPI